VAILVFEVLAIHATLSVTSIALGKRDVSIGGVQNPDG